MVFWQVDQYSRIRSGKIMSYDPLTLKRQGNPNWAHTYFKSYNYKMEQCLFGLHQIKGMKTGVPICIVESEKTAIIMSGYYPDIIWMATGGINGLKKDSIAPIKKYRVFLYPDIGAELKWEKKTTGLSNISIVDWAKVLGIEPKDHDGDDLADFPHPDTRIPLP